MAAKKNKTTRAKLAKLAHELDKAKNLKFKQKESFKKIMGHPPHFDTTKPKSK